MPWCTKFVSAAHSIDAGSAPLLFDRLVHLVFLSWELRWRVKYIIVASRCHAAVKQGVKMHDEDAGHELSHARLSMESDSA